MSGRLSSLSDEKLASELRSDQPLMRFIGVKPNAGAPSAKAQRTCRGALGEATEGLLAELNACLAEAGLAATEGHIVDSTSAKAPVRRNSRDGSKAIKVGCTPGPGRAAK